MAANLEKVGDSLPEQNELKGNLTVTSARKKKETLVKGTLLLTGVAGAAVIFGFATTLGLAKRRSPAMFNKGFLPVPSAEMPESGASLGMRALGWGTVFSISGVGLLTFAVCKTLGIQSLSDFKNTMQSTMPRIKRNENAMKEISLQDLSRQTRKGGEDNDITSSDSHTRLNTEHDSR